GAAPPGRRYSCITVGGVVSSSTGPRRGRFVPQDKQIRSSWLTVAAQPGQVSVAMASSGTSGGRWSGPCVHLSVTRQAPQQCPRARGGARQVASQEHRPGNGGFLPEVFRGGAGGLAETLLGDQP